MAVTANSGVPEHIQSGDTIRFTWSSGDHPAASWSAKFALNKDGVSVLVVDATESGSDYTVTISAAQSAQLRQGTHQWLIRYTETASGEVETGETGIATVLANLGVNQTQTTAASLLAAIEETILTLLSGTTSSASFNGQSYTEKDLGTLHRIRRELRAEVIAENNALEALRGGGAGRGFQVRFQ